MQHNFLQTLFSLDGKVALVTGASSGIGCHMAKTLASAGAHVILVARRHSKLHEIAQHIEKKGGSAAICPANLLELNEIDRLYEDALIPFGNPDILVNAAGVNFREAPEKISWDSWNKTLMINLSVPFFLAKGFVSGMREKKSGRIINIISTSVKQPLNGLGVSNTIRGAVANWAKTLANELGPYNITVNNILPGATNTGRLKEIINNKAQKLNLKENAIEKQMASQVPLNRIAEPIEVANAVVFLASDKASYINGINLPVDGGRTKSL